MGEMNLMFMEFSEEFICEDCYALEIKEMLTENGLGDEASEIIELTRQNINYKFLEPGLCVKCGEIKNCFPSVFLFSSVVEKDFDFGNLKIQENKDENYREYYEE